MHPEPTLGGENASAVDVFVALQPIFDSSSALHGYELLFRSTAENAYEGDDANRASAEVLNRALHVMGLTSLAGDKRMFVNFPGPMLIDESYAVLPPDRCVIELLETAEIIDDLVAACRRLKDAGYALALDD